MLKRHKDLLRSIVSGLRAVLSGSAAGDGSWQRGDLDRELERLGIAPDGSDSSLDALPNVSLAEQRARYSANVALSTAANGTKDSEAQRLRAAARIEFVERAAYTWMNRLLALRAMEARSLIDEILRSNPAYDGLSEALYVLRMERPALTGTPDAGWWTVIEEACMAQAKALPGLFDLADPNAALRPSSVALLQCVTLLGNAPQGYSAEEADAAFADPDAIGWAYQFYQEAAKGRVYAKLSSGGKASTRAEIAAATQLFTEPYMVQWLLQNSLGQSYHLAYPESRLPTTWAYYIHRHRSDQSEASDALMLPALTLLDPCCGSGHFLREAFDMLAAMYREQHPELRAAEIADRVLERHLHGVDLDPRAAQLAALTLYLRAWEFVRQEARQQHRSTSPVPYQPAAIHIATSPHGLNAGALERHMRRHPEDRVMRPLLEGVFAALEQADILGSLIRPAEHIDAAIAELHKPHTIRMDFDEDDASLRRTITALAHSNPADLKRVLLERVASSFHNEAGKADDVSAQLFGREAEGGVRLLQLMDRKYALVVTNPPYMGSANMDMPLKRYIEQYYKPGKRDIYAAFILRCLQLCRSNGRVAMITQQSWMFLRSFAELRALPHDQLAEAQKKGQYTGLLRESSIEALAHLGEFGFDDVSAAGAFTAMFVLANRAPSAEHRMIAFRLVGLKSAAEKGRVLREAAREA